MKVCSKCGVEKEYSEFNKRKKNKDGFRYKCRQCEKEYYKLNKDKLSKQKKEYYELNKDKLSKQKKEYNELNKDKISEYQKEYNELNKDKLSEYQKEYYELNKDKLSKQKKEYNELNKDKISEYQKEYNELNKDKLSEYQKEYRKLNKDKFTGYFHKRQALKYRNGGSYTTEQWNECLNYFNNECAYTGKPLDNEVLHVEHIQAISKGGTSYIWNLCPSIASANFSKNNKELEEWYKQQEYYTEERLNKIYEWQDYAYNKYKEFEEVV